jgi:hypothetical protein
MFQFLALGFAYRLTLTRRKKYGVTAARLSVTEPDAHAPDTRQGCCGVGVNCSPKGKPYLGSISIPSILRITEVRVTLTLTILHQSSPSQTLSTSIHMPSSRCKADGCDNWACTNEDFCDEHREEKSSVRQIVHNLSAHPTQVRETPSQPI